MIKLGMYHCSWCGHEEQDGDAMDAHVTGKHLRQH